ncbi:MULTISPECIES: AbfB domain-containing protein [Streptomyces]|uniref:AbfB domain-containing protein n=2 Tax=Streptomyces TaxID=1883 RepID=A0ABV9ITE4_9ACTN
MPENKSRPPQDQPWENGWAPDSSRAPGTRRLWLAGGLAVATVIACVTTIAVSDRTPDEQSDAREGQTLSDDETGSGLISFTTPSPSPSASGSATASGGEKSPQNTSSSASSSAASSSPSAEGGKGGSAEEGGNSSPTAHSSGTTTPKPTKKPSDPKPPSSYERSVQSVNYPDRYWHVSDGLVKLDAPRGSESREDSTFTVVKGLTNSSCFSFKTSDGKYLRHRNFVLRAERNDGSGLFKQDATFCSRPSSFSGAVMLESVNYPGRFLRHQNFALRLDPYGYATTNRPDFSFRVVAPLG